MATKMRCDRDRRCIEPCVLCDVCGDAIDVRGGGAEGVVLSLAPAPGKPVSAFFAHKGDCHKAKEYELELEPGVSPGDVGWMDFDVYLAYLLASVGMTPAKLKEAVETAKNLGRLMEGS